MRRIFQLPTDEVGGLPSGGHAAATPNQRACSVWPLICSRATKFVATLKHRERVNFDAEDVAVSLWLALRKKDPKWSPEHGAYASFAAVVIHNELCSIRDTAGTVEGPRNITDRLKEYQVEEDAGTLTPKRAATFESIRRTVGEYKPVGDGDRMDDTRPDELAEASEQGRLRRDSIVDALRVMSPIEARIFGLSYGLWGQPRLSTEQIADAVDRPVGFVRQARRVASEKIRERLRAAGHAHIASDN